MLAESSKDLASAQASLVEAERAADAARALVIGREADLRDDSMPLKQARQLEERLVQLQDAADAAEKKVGIAKKMIERAKKRQAPVVRQVQEQTAAELKKVLDAKTAKATEALEALLDAAIELEQVSKFVAEQYPPAHIPVIEPVYARAVNGTTTQVGTRDVGGDRSNLPGMTSMKILNEARSLAPAAMLKKILGPGFKNAKFVLERLRNRDGVK
jgi:hypothetical protein